MRAGTPTTPSTSTAGTATAAEQFGLSERRIAERFARYADRFGLTGEPAGGE